METAKSLKGRIKGLQDAYQSVEPTCTRSKNAGSIPRIHPVLRIPTFAFQSLYIIKEQRDAQSVLTNWAFR